MSISEVRVQDRGVVTSSTYRCRRGREKVVLLRCAEVGDSLPDVKLLKARAEEIEKGCPMKEMESYC